MAKSRPERPYHCHDRADQLMPGRVYEVDVEVWPTCIVAPSGYRLGLSILGKDYEHGRPATTMGATGIVMRGAGPFLHNDAADRPKAVFENRVSIYSGPSEPSHILLPLIPNEI